ncbi:autotransporter outer membrane beta-barrel domain-containing protein, partial [Rickettsia hoogstraalii]|uniref:autotransporter outer membrane beta-barrel domain-containing protein n=1 Tax=Rickettsia hoogstraalii TaxID=467174 RepID=UPI0022560712
GVTSIDATTVTINNAAADVLATGVITAAVNFAADGALTANNGITGAVTTKGNNTGTLTVGAGNVTGAIGTNGGNILKQVFFNGASGVTSIDATTVTINNAAADVLATGVITAAVNFAADGALTANNGITGAVTTANNNTGTLTVGAGNVTGAIGTNGGAILKVVQFEDQSNVTTIDATTVNIGNVAANVTAAGAITAAVSFGADGALTANNGITGAVTTKGNNTGTLTVGAGNVTGAIGTNGGNILKQVFFNGASGVTSIDATTVTINNAAADVLATGVITAAVNFAADGALTANNGITGAVTAAGGNGTLTTAGVGVTGAVGTNAASLKVLNAKVDNGAADLVFGSDIYAQTVNFDDIAGGGAVGTIQVGGNLVATNVNFVGNAAGGTLEFNGPLDGGGKVIHYQFKGAIVNGNNAILNVNTGSLTAYHPTIGTVAGINIGANNLFAIDASAGDVTILDGQAIAFGNAGSVLALSNLTGVGVKNVLLAADLAAPGANEGGLIFNGGANGLNIGSNAAGTARKMGDGGGDKFNSLFINNVVTITDDVNLDGIHNVIVNDNADFTSNTAVNADAIQINDGIYRVDASGGNVAVPAANIEFAHANAQLVLQNSSNADDRTITLGADIDPNNDDEGIVTLNSVNAGKKLTIAGGVTLGGAHRLQAIKFQGVGDFGTAGITFNTANIELDTTGATELGATLGNVILINNNVQLTQTGNIVGFLDFNATNGTVTLNNGVNIAGAVQNTGGTNNGTLIALGASNLGSVNGLTMLKVGAGAVSITQGGNTSITEIQGNGTALLTLPANFNLTGSINKTGGQALKLNFTNGGSVSGVVGTAANSVGDITTAGTTNFESSVNAKGAATLGGTTSFADTFTNTGAVTLAKASITNFAKNVTATSFAANNATINFGNSLAFNSNITGSGTTLTLGASQVTYTGTGGFTDTLTLNTTFDGAAKSGGNILIKSCSTLDLSGVSTLALVVTATNFDINNISPDTKYTVISAEAAGGLKPTPAGNVKVTVNNDNRFVNFTFDESTLTLFAKDVSQEVIDNDFKPGGPLANIPNAANIKKSLELMEQAPIGSDARLVFGNWGKLTPIQEADAVTHLMQDVVKPSDTIAAINNQVILSNISSSLINLNARMDVIQPAAVAAGDKDRDAKFGAWISPFVGNATQKMRNNISGYKSDTTGGTIGFDGLVNDDLALGLAYTRADTDIKLKNNKTGYKNKVESNIYSVYGLYNVPYENLFVEAIASYSDNRIKSKSRRVIATALETVGYQTASGKYKSESYTGQLMAGYTYMMPENINLTPLVGLRYSVIKDNGYKETGTTNQNLTVKGKNYNTFDGLLGAKVSSNINVGEVVLTPELYAMVDYAFKNKVPAIDARLQGMTAPFPTNSFKQSKTSFDVGVGVTAKHKMMEYGINYDTNIGSKYFAQQGSVKVRVNF